MKATRENGSMEVRVPSGVTLEERREPDGRTSVSLRAPDGGLLLEYILADGTCRIHAPKIEIEAEQNLRLAGRHVQIESERGIVLRSGDTTIAVEPDEIGLLTEELPASATSTEWTSKTFPLAADRAETEVQRVGELETHARQFIERTRESHREAEGLAQTKAGRIRSVADDIELNEAVERRRQLVWSRWIAAGILAVFLLLTGVRIYFLSSGETNWFTWFFDAAGD